MMGLTRLQIPLAVLYKKIQDVSPTLVMKILVEFWHSNKDLVEIFLQKNFPWKNDSKEQQHFFLMFCFLNAMLLRISPRLIILTNK